MVELQLTVSSISLEPLDLSRATTSREDSSSHLNTTPTASEQRKDTVVSKVNGRLYSGWCANVMLLAILWKESSSTSPDPFQMTANPSAVAGTGAPTACPNSYIYIPNLSPDGIKGLPSAASTSEYYSTLCGSNIGHDNTAISLALASTYMRYWKVWSLICLLAIQQPFIVGVYTGTSALTSPTTGFNIDYTQVSWLSELSYDLMHLFQLPCK